ncbi:hypothetical protein GA0115247_11691, partial [Streptomyces sp. PalvLS-984]
MSTVRDRTPGGSSRPGDSQDWVSTVRTAASASTVARRSAGWVVSTGRYAP